MSLPRVLVMQALLLLAGCGAAEIVVPEPLWVVDTFPGNGALVPAGDVPLVVAFSADVAEDSLTEAVLLERIAESGAAVEVVPTALGEYLFESRTATFQAPSLPPDTAYSLTVRAETLRGLEGATLVADVVRRFKTEAP